MQIEWKNLSREEFERIVEALVRRNWEGAATVIVPEGRGGDGGIDIDVIQPDYRRIYQLKHFIDGFSGNLKSTRRRQIKKSFLSAIELEPKPDEWLIVIPAKLTPDERKFIRALAGTDGPKISIIDVTELDHLAIEHPDVYGYFDQHRLQQNAILFKQERENLTGGASDLAERVAKLGRLGDTLDLYWGLDFSRSNESLTCTLRPKTSDAFKKSPIKFTLTGGFGPEHAELAKAFRNTIGFGGPDPILLSSDVVQSLAIDGPPFIAGIQTGVEVTLTPIGTSPHIGSSAQLTFETEDGVLRGSYEGAVTHSGHGPEGATLEINFNNNHLTIRLRFPLSGEDRPIDLEASFHLHEIKPTDAVQVLEVNELLHSIGTMSVSLDDVHLISMHQDNPDQFSKVDPEIGAIHAIASDLVVVQAYCKKTFNLPATVSSTDRLDLRVARLLIEGNAVEIPAARSLEATLTGHNSSELREMLRVGTSLRIEGPEFQVTLGRKILPIGPLYLADPATHAEDPDDAIEAIENGSAAGLTIKLVPGTTRFFRGVLVKFARADHFTEAPTPWELDGFPQPPFEEMKVPTPQEN